MKDLLESERCERSDSDNAVSNLSRSALGRAKVVGSQVRTLGKCPDGEAVDKFKKDRVRASEETPWLMAGQTMDLNTGLAHKKAASRLESCTQVNGYPEGSASLLSGVYRHHISTVFEEIYNE